MPQIGLATVADSVTCVEKERSLVTLSPSSVNIVLLALFHSCLTETRPDRCVLRCKCVNAAAAFYMMMMHSLCHGERYLLCVHARTFTECAYDVMIIIIN